MQYTFVGQWMVCYLYEISLTSVSRLGFWTTLTLLQGFVGSLDCLDDDRRLCEMKRIVKKVTNLYHTRHPTWYRLHCQLINIASSLIWIRDSYRQGMNSRHWRPICVKTSSFWNGKSAKYPSYLKQDRTLLNDKFSSHINNMLSCAAASMATVSAHSVDKRRILAWFHHNLIAIDWISPWSEPSFREASSFSCCLVQLFRSSYTSRIASDIFARGTVLSKVRWTYSTWVFHVSLKKVYANDMTK